MISQNITILLADDNNDDCLLFKEALKELPVSSHLSIVHDGDQLMEQLTQKETKLPDVLFLDLHMPRKNGFASLGAIKRNTELQQLPVIILSSVSEQESVKNVFRDAAHYYICKPANFSQLKKVIYEALILITQKNNPLPDKESFIITGYSTIIPN
jgi:CheY-like chemotaxis protein